MRGPSTERRVLIPALLTGLALIAPDGAAQTPEPPPPPAPEAAAIATAPAVPAVPAVPTTPAAGSRVREAPPQAHTRTKNLSRSFEVGGRTVSVVGQGMDLRVRAGDGDRATVDATLEYWSDSEEWMDAIAEQYDVSIEERSDSVKIDFGDMPERHRGGLLRRIFGGDDYSWSLDVVLTVPAGTALDIDNRYGPVDVDGIGGDLNVVNSSGEVTVRDAAATRIENTYAAVQVSDVSGPLTVRSGSAEVTIDGAAAGVDASTSYAALHIQNVIGDVVAEASSGTLEIRHVEGDVRSRNTYARATIEDVAGRLDHETSSGEVQIRDVGGDVHAVGSYAAMTVERVGAVEARNGSGAVTVAAARGDVTVSNSYAPVRLRDIGGAVRVDSSSAGVEIENAAGGVDVTTSYDGVHIRGVGGAVRVRNGSGRVSVEGFRGDAVNAAHDIETSYAGIEIVWPADTEVGIEARSTYGGIDSEIGGAVASSGSRHELNRESAGGGQLHLVTSSGSIRIRTH